MADIKKYLDSIKTAIFGKDVRKSIYDGIEAINNDCTNRLNKQDSELSQSIKKQNEIIQTNKLKQDELERKYDEQIKNIASSEPQNAEIVDARCGFETLGSIIKKKIYHFDNVEEMKNCLTLVPGDVVETLGYYEINDGGGGTYKIRSKTEKDIIDNAIIIGIKKDFVAELIVNKNINVKQFGCFGDDKHDDTIQFEKALNFATYNDYNVEIPTGTYKITRQISLKYYRYINSSGSSVKPKKSIKIFGMGTIFSTKDQINSSVIKGYNISDKSSILAFTGKGVDSSTSISLENISIVLDNETCEELSFCLILGDANFTKISHCCFKGYNNVMHRCSSAQDDNINGIEIKADGYLFANIIYEQTKFDTNLYLDWNKTTINEKNKFGFAIVDERLFCDNNNNNWKKYSEDSVTFNNCLFRGAVYSQISQALFNNCMWEFPTAYKPNIDISTDLRFNQNYLSNKVINCGIGLTILSGKVQLNSPYFEDCQRQINIRKCQSSYPHTIYSVDIINAHFNTSINAAHGAIIDDEEIKAIYAINIEDTGYNVNSLNLEGCYFNNDNPFTDAEIKNTICRYININNCWGIKNELIKDTGSYSFHRSTKELDIVNLKFEGILENNGGRLFKTLESQAICEKLPNKKYLLQSAKIYVDGLLTDGLQIQVLKSATQINKSSGLLSYKFKLGGDYEKHCTSVITDDSSYEIFNYDAIPGNTDGENYKRYWDFEANSYVGVTFYNNSGASSENIGRTVIVELVFRG